MKIAKTNAARLLDRAKVDYELIPYPVDESDLSADHVAQVLHEAIEQIFKTLVLKGNTTGYFVCIVPGDMELDLKKTAKMTGNKHCDMIPVKDLPLITGYLRGACSPVGMKKRFPTFLHESSLRFDRIYVSAGQRGLQLKIDPRALIPIVNATLFQ